MTKYRYTVETLASGQPRAYADTINHVRVTLEWEPSWGPNIGKWVPYPSDTDDITKVNLESLYDLLKGLRCGFTDYKYNAKEDPGEGAYFRTRLDWIKMVKPGVWEFHTTSKYTD